VALLCPGLALAHKPSDSYLTLTAHDAGVVDVQWHVALRDLDGELQLDANDDGQLNWGEVRSRWAAMEAFVKPHVQFKTGGQACHTLSTPWPENPAPQPALATHSDGRYAVFSWREQCPVAAAGWTGVDVAYRLFALSDPTHRGIVRWRTQVGQGVGQGEGRELGVAVLGVQHPTQHLGWPGTPMSMTKGVAARGDGPSGAASMATPASAALAASAAPDVPWRERAVEAAHTVARMVGEGVHHIADGTDHILFLVSLLLVSVWRRDAGDARWLPREDARSVLAEVLRLVTAFTVAHSITLGLAAHGVLTPPSRWVESLIAASVLVAALDNLWPLLRGPRWAVVFAFGLVHGFGFAGAMQDLGLSAQALAWPLLGFNLGVELGQLMLVAAVLPLAFALRRKRAYRWAVVAPASAAIAALALIWLIERSTDRLILSGAASGFSALRAWAG
jgi:hypothetical protein